MSAPVLFGTLAPGEPISVLQAVEMRRTSGVLRFKTPNVEGDIALVAGQLGVEQVSTSTGEDPVEVFLGLREGTYEVFQRLPSLPVTKGDDQHRAGSLGVHTPGSLTTFCEKSGLTGLLLLRTEHREAQLIYAAGELRAIAIDGQRDADVHELFGWQEGTFEVIAYSAAPPEQIDALVAAPDANVMPGRDPTFPRIRLLSARKGDPAYRVEEMPSESLVLEREKRRVKPADSPAMPAARPSYRPPPAREAEGPQTVRIVFLAKDAATSPPTSDTRYVQGSVAREEPLANPPAPRPKVSVKSSPRPASKGAQRAWIWFLLVIAAAIVAALLARSGQTG